MDIEYRKFDALILDRISSIFDNDGLRKQVIFSDETFPFAAMDGDDPIGYIYVTPRALAYPLEHIKDAYIEIIEVHDDYQRRGIGQYLVLCAEDWARKAGFRQIRTHSNDKAVKAIHMWHKLNYGLCQHDYHEFEPDTNEYKNQFSGYWVAKVLSANGGV